MVYTTDPYGNFTYFNEATNKILGYNPTELLSRHFTSIIYSEDLEEVTNFYQKQFSELIEETFFELRIVKKDGTISWVSQNIRAIFNEDGSRVLRYTGTVRNIDRRKAAEQNLKESEEKYRELFDNSTDLIHSINKEGNFLYVNRVWREVMGYSEEEISKLSLFDIIHEDSKQLWNLLFESINTSGLAPEGRPSYYMVSKSGKKILVEGSVTVKVENGEILSLQSFLRDITEQEEIAEELKKSSDNMRHITETLTDAYYLFNITQNKYEYISSNCERVMGANQDFFYAGKSHTDTFVHPDDRAKVKQANKLVNAGAEYNIEYRVIINDEIRWVNERSIAIRDEYKNIILNSGVCRDVTEAIHNQELLEQRNNEITQSIEYAQVIQNSVLPTTKEISALLPDHFVFISPKSNISGDFYMVEQVRSNDMKMFTAFLVADCTGHGIPGGILSLLCHALAKETFTRPEVNHPSEALDYIRSQLISLFRASEDRKFHDGMDVAFCILNQETKVLHFSGAHNPCIIVRNGEIFELKGDRYHVGYNDFNGKFTRQQFQTQPGDKVYLFTDGFTDQFGGPDHRKFMRKRFYELILELEKYPMAKQKEFFMDEFFEWKGDGEQTDDVTLMGIQL